MQIKIDSNFSQVQRRLGALGKQARFAAAVALTRTAKDVQQAMPAELERSLDNPTDFTKRGTYTRPARRDTLVSEVGFRDIQARYMRLQIEGGTYTPKEAGIRLPGNVQLNAFGNIPRGLVNKLKAAAKDGKLEAAVAKRLNVETNRRKGAAPIQLFYGQPAGRGWEKAPVGIWRRIPPATPGGKGKLVPVVVFERKSAQYEARFDLPKLAMSVAEQKFAEHFRTELEKALRTAR